MSVRKRIWTNADGSESERWIVNYTDQDGVRRLKTFPTKKEARSWSDATGVEVRHGTHSVESQSLTVAEAAENWIKAVQTGRKGRGPAEASTLRQYRYHRDTYIVPRLGRIKLSQLSPERVEVFVGYLLEEKNLSRPLAKKVLTSLKGILAVARQAHRAAGVSFGTGNGHDEVVVPSIADIKAILAKLDEKAAASPAWHRWRALIATAIHTGLRASELRGLPWSSVDLKKGEIRVTQKADEDGVISTELKSKTAKRTIPIPSDLVQILREWRVKANHELVFATGTGKPEALANIFNRAWKPVQIAAGVADKIGRDEEGRPIVQQRYNFHSLRHFHASVLIADNANPKEVQLEMGHSSIKITYDIYGHLFRDDEATKRRSERAERLAGLLK